MPAMNFFQSTFPGDNPWGQAQAMIQNKSFGQADSPDFISNMMSNWGPDKQNMANSIFGDKVGGTIGNIANSGGMGGFLKNKMTAPTTYGPGGIPAVSSEQGAMNALTTPAGKALSPVSGGAASPELAAKIMGGAGGAAGGGAAAGGAMAGL